MRAKAFWLILVALGLGTKRHWHILFAIILGIGLGLAFPNPVVYQFFYVISQLFMRLIHMVVIPLVVSSLIVGVSSLGDSKQLGRMGGKVLSYFLLLMVISALLGAGLALLAEPGHHITNFPISETEKADLLATIQTTPDIQTLLLNMVPENPMAALANADLLAVILFTLFMGASVASIGEAGRPIVNFFEALFSATMKLTDWIMVLAVPGVFSLAYIMVVEHGLGIFQELYPYASIIIVGLLIQVFVIFPLLLKFFAKIDFMSLYRAISEAVMVAFGTASSSATLPITIACCERRAGISNRIASFVLPTGATINKTGTTMFEVIAVLFLIQLYAIPLSFTQLAILVTMCIVASVGAAGVPSAGLITMSIVLGALGHINATQLAPGIALIWSIDRVLDMCRTVVNVISSCTVAALVASSEGELNRDTLNNHEAWMEVV